MGIMVQAHRGASAYAPENTLPSFRLAVEMKADGVENDIRLTKDGVVVVSHDSNVARMSNGKGEIHELTFEELRSFDFGIKTGTQFEGTKIPTLEEFLEVVSGMRIINIELKPIVGDKSVADYTFAKLYDALKKFDCVDRTIISSFAHESLRDLKHAHPDLRTALLYGHALTPDQTVDMVRKYDADIIHPALGCINKEIVDLCLSEGIEVNVWTVDADADIQRAIDLDVTGIITDVPDKVLRALGR